MIFRKKKKKRNSKKQTKKERKRKKKKNKKRQQACNFSRLQGDKLVFVRCSVCGGKFVVSKFACGAVRLHACSVHSNALGKSGQQWSLDRLTGRCALYIYKSRKSSKKLPSFHFNCSKSSFEHRPKIFLP